MIILKTYIGALKESLISLVTNTLMKLATSCSLPKAYIITTPPSVSAGSDAVSCLRPNSPVFDIPEHIHNVSSHSDRWSTGHLCPQLSRHPLPADHIPAACTSPLDRCPSLPEHCIQALRQTKCSSYSHSIEPSGPADELHLFRRSR